MKQVPVYIQLRNSEGIETILRMTLAYYGCFPSMEEIRENCDHVHAGSAVERLTESMKLFGLQAEVISEDRVALFERFAVSDDLLIPVLKHHRFCILDQVKTNSVRINDVQKGSVTKSKEKFLQEYTGSYLVLTPAESFVRRGERDSLFRKLFERISDYPVSVAKLTALHVIGATAQIFEMMIIRWLLDENVLSASYSQLVSLMFIVLLVQSATLIGEAILSKRYSQDAVRYNGNRVFWKILNLPFRVYEHFSTGDLMDRMNTNTDLDDTILCILIPFFTDVISVLVYFDLFLHYNVVLAIGCLSVEMIYLLLSIFLQRYIAVLSNSISVSSANLSSVTLRGFDTISTTKSTGAENTFFSMWRNHENAYLAARLKIQQVTELNKFITSCHDTLIDSAILFIGAAFILRGQFTLGMMTSIQTMVRLIENKLESSTYASGQLSQCVASLEKTSDLLTQPSAPGNNAEVSDRIVTGDICARDITFTYPGENKPALAHVSFDIREGQLVALVGHTGCGKSTLLKILQGIYQPDCGYVTYGNYTREQISDQTFHDSLLAMNQEINIFRDTIHNNMTMWDSRITEDSLHEAASAVDIHERIMACEDGYNFVMNKKGSSFSGGELQRMEFAGALTRSPSFLLLDEFTSAQDAIREAKAMEILRNKGVTCIMAAHRLSTVVKADWIIVMDKGKIIEQGTHDTLYKSGNFYKKLIDMGK